MKGLEGSRLGRYELRFRVAQGGMSEVYLGYDRRVRRYVAVKVLYGSDEPFVRRFEREALAIGTLSHEHILPLYDFGEQQPWYYLVMPFVDGGTLRDYLYKKEQLSLEEAGSFLEQIASALQHAHDHGVIHRDVKPSNILLRLDGHAYLADFGLAKAKLEAKFLTHSGAMIGTPEYTAPEQSNGENDYRSDIYSLGIILYQMLTGRVPFMADSPFAVTLKHLQSTPVPPTQLNSAIPTSIEQIILKALAKNPEERYQEAQSMAIAYKKAIFQAHTRDLEENILALSSTGKSESVGIAQKAEATIAAIEQMTTQIDIPTNRPRLFPIDGESTFKHYTAALQKKRRRTHRHSLTALGLLLFCIGVIAPLSGLWQAAPSTVDKARPTATTNATTTQQSKATATRQAHLKAQATLAARARIQATTGVTSAVGNGTLLYYNAMTARSAGWLDDGKQCYFTGQGYHVTTRAARAVAWCYSNVQRYANIAVTVQARLLYGDFCGLVFRLNPATKTFYVLEVNSIGEFRLQRAQGNDPAGWLTLIDWTYTYAMITGYGVNNKILVVANGAQLRFYINQQLIISTFVDAAYAAGLIGLLVGGDSTRGTEAVFSQVAVFQQ